MSSISVDLVRTEVQPDERIVWFKINIRGYETENRAVFLREYPKEFFKASREGASEWDEPRIELESWDAHNGHISVKEKVKAYRLSLEMLESVKGELLKD